MDLTMNIHRMIARKLKRDPSVLDQALATLRYWRTQDFLPLSRARQWLKILTRAKKTPEGMTELIRLLRDDSEDALRLKNFAPFAGILSREERRKAYRKCAYSH